MNRIGKVVFAGLVFAVSTLLMAPAASACCTPCAGFCTQPGVPPTAYCCTGIPEPGNACGLTICGKWLQGQRSDDAAVEAAVLMTPAASEASCEQVFPWLAARAATAL